jgi:predicted SnoaL-like aldol condensation-catalyzing enzyme
MAGTSATAGASGVGGASAGGAAGKAGTGATAATGGGGAGNGGQSGAGGAGAVGGASGGTGGSGTGGASGDSGCDPSLAASNEISVNAALDALFVDKQLSAIDRYWAEPYLQHNPIAESGVDAFRNVMSSIVSSPSFSYERLRTLAECDLAVVQGRYSGTGVIFDIFRLNEGKLVEHWDSDAGQASEANGPTDVSRPEETAQNRSAVLAFLERLIEGEHEAAVAQLAPVYLDHRGDLLEDIESGAISYTEVHHVIADGNFVFTLSEGQLDGRAYGFYDLFRLEGGRIAEHWDSRRVVPTTTASGLGIF